MTNVLAQNVNNKINLLRSWEEEKAGDKCCVANL